MPADLTRRRGRASVAALFLVTLLSGGPARADEPNSAEARRDEATVAFVLGATTFVATTAFGAFVMANGGAKNRGIFLLHAGYVLAPLGAHGLVGEWERGIWFSLIPVATGVANAMVVEATPNVQVGGKAADRTTYELLLMGALGASVVGVVDVLGAPARKERRLHVAPLYFDRGFGVGVGGSL